MPSRRAVVATASVGLAGVLTGCSDEASTTTSLPETELRLGAASSVAIQARSAAEYDYHPATDSVSVEDTTGETHTMSFDEWGTRRATGHATEHVKRLFDDASVLVSLVSVGRGSVELPLQEAPSRSSADTATGSARPPEFERALPIGPVVSYTHAANRESDEYATPEVSFAAVVAATPRAVEATVSFAPRDYMAVLPVLCERVWQREN